MSGKAQVRTKPDLGRAQSVSGVLQRRCACGTHSPAGGECMACEKQKVSGQLQRNAISGESVDEVPALVHEVVNSSGQPLDVGPRSFMESHFNHDFSRVRVHTNAKAAESARAVNALAYTVGREVVFGRGQYAPHTNEGRRLLAHELTHVVQQTRLGGSTGSFFEGSGEWEADQNAGSISGSQPCLVHFQARPNALQRQRATPEREGTAQAPAGTVEVIRAAERAKREPNDRTGMLLSASEIVYRLIHLFLPDYKSRISGVGYEEAIKGVRVDVTGRSISITVGKQFVLATNENTLEQRALDLGHALLIKAPREKSEQKGLLQSMYEQQQRAPGPEITFDEALKEGANVLHAANFGLVCGLGSGPDIRDRYDARDWKEKEGRREILVAKIEPWLAFYKLIKNLGKQVPAASGGTTTWGFDCFGFVIVNRVYAHWRTLTRVEFDARYSPLELGINSGLNVEWEKPIESLRPGDKPFISGEVKPGPGGRFVEEKKLVGKSWDELLATAPIGSQVTWGNQDAKAKCTSNPNLSFCPFMFENSTKVGPNQYSAHPFGIVTREFIEDAMAKAVLSAEAQPTTDEAKKTYIKKFVYISGMRLPKKQQGESVSA